MIRTRDVLALFALCGLLLVGTLVFNLSGDEKQVTYQTASFVVGVKALDAVVMHDDVREKIRESIIERLQDLYESPVASELSTDETLENEESIPAVSETQQPVIVPASVEQLYIPPLATSTQASSSEALPEFELGTTTASSTPQSEVHGSTTPEL